MWGVGASGLALGRLVARSRAIAFGNRRDLDLARLELLGLGDIQAQDAVLERGGRLVRLEAVRQSHRAAEAAPPDLLEDVAALLGGSLVRGLARDGHRAVLDRDVDVIGPDARQRRLDRHAIR